MKAILWDMDGTLVDTEPKWGQATYTMCSEMGRELTPEVRESTVGGIAENTVRICADWAGLTLDDAALHHWVDRLYTIVSELFSADLPFRPGIPELLAEGAATLPMMVVTNTYRSLTDRALQTIGADRFVGSVCGDEVAHGKPAPEPYLRACQLLGLAPADCLVVEDSTNGMRSAVAAGCRVLGVPSPGNPVPTGAVDIVDLRRPPAGDSGDRPGKCSGLAELTVSDLRDMWGRIGVPTADVPQ
ncbi:HAD family phosphatase [uncultured Corynebacterium sp.]|uniref:HAD family hydrolase n=1 Tax=uncultured Corynebacterium sp. TaxID=159447 RepID=UPI0025E4DFF8|nr:HAD family phosphatase [uncultured Corynebacterium sp.]